MRLLKIEDNNSFSLVEHVGSSIPPYAILSHTWGPDEEEVTFKDLVEGTGESKFGYRKLRFCGERAARDGLDYFWVDTSCIDKASSAELSEAINSMFRWYQQATKCYVYMSDVSVKDQTTDGETFVRWKPGFKKSRWFTRGWTLQELIAPTTVEFFSRDGVKLGDKISLEQTIHEITGIAVEALRGSPLSQFSVEERMGWSKKRQTKREEDEAYCLLGIFDIHMPLIYGEGRENALSRLQKKMRNRERTTLEPLTKKEKIEFLMKSLKFDEIESRQMTIKTAHAETCQWLLTTPEYLAWLDETNISIHHGFMWIKGNPGTGKSTIMKFALTHAQSTMPNRLHISFFFNARGADLEKSTIGTYRSLLLQLLQQVPSLQEEILFSLGLTDSQIKVGYQWNVVSLKALLRTTIRRLGNNSVICFIDALDECEERQIRDMISFLEQISDIAVSVNVRLQVFFASRHYPNITIRRGISLVLERASGHKNDIARYLSSELKIGNSKKAENIRTQLQEKASGIFMWVVLVVEILNKEYESGRMHALQKRLQEIPGDLHQLFHDILTRDSYNREELIVCVRWILFARQPLSPRQLYYAILSHDSENLSELDQDEVTTEVIRRFILDSSKGLAQFTESAQPKVQFIHESIKDFLLKDDGLGRIWPNLRSNFEGQGHEQLKFCCMNYLKKQISHSHSPKRLAASMRAASTAHPNDVDFIYYVVENVLYHADTAESFGLSQDIFLKDFPLDHWIQLENNHTEWVSLLYVLAHYNMSNLIRIHPFNLDCLKVEKDRCGTPLFAAVAAGNTEAVQAFIDAYSATQSPQSSINTRFGRYKPRENTSTGIKEQFVFSNQRTTLSYLAECGDAALFALGLAIGGIAPHEQDQDGTTPLWWAAACGHVAIARILLNIETIGANVDHDGDDTVFSLMVESGQDAVKLLGMESFQKASKRSNKQKALKLAARYGNATVMRFLLRAGDTDPDLKDNQGRTALSIAAAYDRVQIGELLLHTGKVNVNAKDDNQWAVLSHAANACHYDFIKLLLDTEKVDIDSKNCAGQTALSLAVSNIKYTSKPQRSVVELLLGTGKADINSKDLIGYTPLSRAAEQANTDLVELLLDTGKAGINATNQFGRTALMNAARHPSGARVCQLLLNTGKVDVNLQEKDGLTALQLAVNAGHEETIKLLSEWDR